MSEFTRLCQLSGGCMGCCGHDFLSAELIKDAIRHNTQEFEEASPKSEQDLITFRDRKSAYDLRYGVCRNLIKKDCQLLCPLHPALNSKDLRIGHCELHYMCPTAKAFENWTKTKQEEFITFIEAKKLDNITYSMKMSEDELLNEFEKE